MAVHLKTLRDQIIVLTGAGSRIGLCTARLAAGHGAAVVLASRSGEDLHELVSEIQSQGGRAVAVAADLAHEQDVRRLAEQARRSFGGFDTWINNADVSAEGPALEVSAGDMRRLFDTNVWGVVNGSRVACETLRQRGGALINVGSELSDQPAPLRVASSASRQAVQAWTDGMRIELLEEGAPISVTLIKAAAIDAPCLQHAGIGAEDEPTPGSHSPGTVARAILHAATTPVRELFVGDGATFVSTLHPMPRGRDNRAVRSLLAPAKHRGKTRSRQPVMAGAVIMGASLLIAAWMRSGKGVPPADATRSGAR